MASPGAPPELVTQLAPIVEETVAAFAPLNLAKPQLSRALSRKRLTRPSFTFLHDLISSTIRSTGKFADLHSESERDRALIHTREGKLAYFEKVVAAVGICLGRAVDVRPEKMLAGLEAECTNVFLQSLAQVVLSDRYDHAAAVEAQRVGKQPGDVDVRALPLPLPAAREQEQE
jgi:hypothetical protein